MGTSESGHEKEMLSDCRGNVVWCFVNSLFVDVQRIYGTEKCEILVNL
jgi:hypothetical protein